MSSNSTFISASNQKRWILEIDKYISKEHLQNIDSEYSTCVFRVPKSLTETKPEAYAPHQIGLGPYHHLRPEFYILQKHKLSAIKSFLGEEKLHVFNEIVATLIDSEPVVRACYDQYLDFDMETLAVLLAVDILYTLHLFEASEIADWNLVGDVMMLENQIPVILLRKIHHHLTCNNICKPEEHLLSQEFERFCRAHSPLQLGEMDRREMHLLHRMYHMIIEFRYTSIERPVGLALLGISFIQVVCACLEIPGQILANVDSVKRILAWFERQQESPNLIEIDIPTASEMSEKAGIRFVCDVGEEGIRDIAFNSFRKHLHLPRIRPDANSEIILRNLVAFEAAASEPGSDCELASYLDLMSAIVKAKKDVDILKEEGIIEGALASEEIVGIFNGLRRSTGGNRNKPEYIKKAVEEVIEVYKDVPSVKVQRFLEKNFKASWKIISLVVAIVAVVLVTMKTLCSVFDCKSWFGVSNPVQGLPLFYGDH